MYVHYVGGTAYITNVLQKPGVVMQWCVHIDGHHNKHSYQYLDL